MLTPYFFHSVFEAFTMDGIAKCAFGLQVDSQNNPDDPFVKHAKRVMDGTVESPVVMIAGWCIPLVINTFIERKKKEIRISLSSDNTLQKP